MVLITKYNLSATAEAATAATAAAASSYVRILIGKVESGFGS